MRWFLLLLIACKREPELQWIDITAQLPGANAEQVAEQLATTIERQVGQLKGVEALTSESHGGFAVISVGAVDDPQDAVRTALEKALPMLPREMPAPAMYQRRGPIVARLAVPLGEGDAVARKLEMLDGVAEVIVCDGGDAPVRYALDLEKLTANGLSVADAYRAAIGDRDHPLATVVKRGITVGDLVTKLPPAPPCRARVRGGATALLEVRAQLGAPGGVADAAAKLGAPLPPLAEAAGPLDEKADGAFAVVEKPGEPPRVLVEHATQAPIAGAELVLTSADRAQLVKTATDVAARLGALATRGLTVETERVLELDRDRAAELGVSTADIAQALALSSSDGLEITRRFVPRAPELRLTATGPLRVRSQLTHGLIPVEDFERITERAVPREVLHVDQVPAVRIYLRERVDVGALPAGVTATWSRTIGP